MTHRPQNIALVDLSYLFKRRYHTELMKEYMAAAKATLRDLGKLREGVEHVILCLDAPPYEHRQAIYPEYKANRPAPEAEERAQRQWLYKEISAAGYVSARCQGYEADDVIATLATQYSEWCPDVRIVCPDKDAAQCVTGRVIQYIPPSGERDWEVRDMIGVEKKFGVTPPLMPLFQALCGDPGDNVPGVPKIGPKTAAELVNKHPSLKLLAEATAAVTAGGGKKSAVFDSLAAHWESLVLSLKLVTLDTNVPLDAEALLSPPVPAESKKEISMEPANDIAPESQAGVDTAPVNPPERITITRPSTTALAEVPAYTRGKYGLTTSDLQPLDLESASTMAKWFMEGGLFRQYENAQQIFSIMVRAKELGIGMAMALANHHVIEGKPIANADLIRALAERDPNFEYLMPVEMSATRVVWEGKHKRQPKPVSYAYTIEEAQRAGLIRKSQYGKEGNWTLRPQDMLNKTAGTKLARLLWPGATMGFYCPEEMGYAQEELDAREAA